MGKNKKTTEEKIVAEARESFDLADFLRGRQMREKTVRVATDEPLGERLGGYERFETVNEFGLRVPQFRTWGLAGEVITLSAQIEGEKAKKDDADQELIDSLDAKVADLKAQIAELSEQLEESSLKIKLRAVPRAIVKDARRAARKHVGITSKSVTPEQEEDYNEEHDAQLLARMVLSVKKVGTGEVNEGLAVEGARALKGFLPEHEYLKLTKAIYELQYENTIAEDAVKDPDFSQGI